MVNFLRVVQLGVTTLLLGTVALANPLLNTPDVGDVVHYNSRPHVTVGHDHKGDALLVPLQQGKSHVGGPYSSESPYSAGSSIRPVSAHASELSSGRGYRKQQRLDRTHATNELKQAHRSASRVHSQAELTHLSAQRSHELAAHRAALHGDHASAALHRAKAEAHGRKAMYHNNQSAFHRHAAVTTRRPNAGALERARLSASGARLSNSRGNRSIAHAGAAKAHLDAAAGHDRAALAHHRAGNYALANLHAQQADAHRAQASMHAPGSNSLPDPTLSRDHAEASHRLATDSRQSALSRSGGL